MLSAILSSPNLEPIINGTQQIKTNSGYIQYKSQNGSLQYDQTSVNIKNRVFSFQGDFRQQENRSNQIVEFYNGGLKYRYQVAESLNNQQEVQTLSYNNFSYTNNRVNNNETQTWNYKDKKNEFSLVNSNTHYVVKGQFQRPFHTKSSFFANTPQLSVKKFDNYDEYQINFKQGLAIYSEDNLQNLFNLKYNINNNNIDYYQYRNQDFIKTLLSVKSSDNFAKIALEDDNYAIFIGDKDFKYAQVNDQFYTESKLEDVSYRVAVNEGEISKTLQYKNLGFMDDLFFMDFSLGKNIKAQVHSDYDLRSLQFQEKIEGYNLSFRYNRNFEFYDFFLNESIFNVFESRFFVVGERNILSRESAIVNISNKTLNLNSDFVNNFHNFQWKPGAMTIGFLKDNQNHRLMISDTSRFGIFGFGYNLQTEKIDILNLNIGFRF